VKIPLNLHEGEVSKFRARDLDGKLIPDAEFESMEAAMAGARADIDRIAALHEAVNQDLTMTPHAAALRVREVALKLGERASERLDQSRVRVVREIERIARSTAAPVPPRETAPLGAEVRQRLAGMKLDDRRKVLAAAMKDNDDTILSAVLAAPPLLSGLTPSEHAGCVAQFRRVRHPAEDDRLDRLQRAGAAVDRAGRSLVAFVEAAASSPAAQAAEAATKRVQEAAAAAAD
jgi:hypothetical protein